MAPENGDCFVCRKHRGEIVTPGGIFYQDDLVCASHGEPPKGKTTQYPGLLFVEPKRHVPLMSGLTRPEAERVGWLTSRLARALEEEEQVERSYLAVLGHHVPHLHVWLIPRYTGTPDDLWGVAVIGWDEGPRASADEVAALCRRVRERLEREE